MNLTYPIKNMDKLQEIEKYLKNKSERDYILFEVGIHLGIKAEDFTQQTVGFYRQACLEGFVRIKPSLTSKYKEDTLVPIPEDLKFAILAYIKGKDDNEWMFPSQKGGTPITRQHIHRILNDVALHVGIENSLSINTLRKTFGYWYYQYNEDIKPLMQIFNHNKEAITLSYIGIIQDTNNMRHITA